MMMARLKVAELREELKKHNQPTHGNKAALGQRLQETLERDEDGNTEENAAAMEAEDGKEGEAVAAEEEEEEEEEGGENAVGIQANGAVGGTFEDPSASGMASFQPNGLPVSKKLISRLPGSPARVTTEPLPVAPSQLSISSPSRGKKKLPAGKNKEKPTTKSSPSSACVVCCSRIVDGKDEALFCEGKCQGWFHRCCAGVSSTHFQALTNSESPFHCSVCTQEQHAAIVANLQNTITALKAEVAEVVDLKIELAELRTAVEVQRADETEQATTKDKASAMSGVPWTEVVKHGSRQRAAQMNPGARHIKSGSNKQRGSPSQVPATGEKVVDAKKKHHKVQKPSIPVLGKRKIWGTLKVCSAATVRNAILQLTNLPQESDLQVKRKYKVGGNGKRTVKWWHVISGNA